MIRQGTEKDLEQIISMLHEYKKSSPLELLHDIGDDTARLILDKIFNEQRGLVFVAENPAGSLDGMLIAIKNVNIWDHTIYCMNELCYWVNPDARGGSAGYKLLKGYIDTCEFMKRGGEIKYYTLSKMVSSPDLNYERFGFKKLEETWSR